VLASGSSGNAALLATSRTRILIDAGLSVKQLSCRLESIGESLSSIDAVLVSHEHSDHVAGLPVLARNRNFHGSIWMTNLTAPSIEWGGGEPRLETFQAGAAFQVGDVSVQSFSIPHDARDPVGFLLESEGLRIGSATDLGYVPDSVKYHLRNTDLLLLEANHDLDMLKVGPYPWAVKQRVMSRVGHLSNLSMSEYLLDSFDASARYLVLGHLSEQNNHPEIARMTAASALAERSLHTQLSVASQRTPSCVFEL
jgi:phosphoribosyl 1,2-cyclic phosphodiesterase